MPSLFTLGPYIIFFWTGEQGEPVHVHVALKRPAKDATKLWLTANGSCIVANNNSKLPGRDLHRVAKFVRSNHELICNRWRESFIVASGYSGQDCLNPIHSVAARACDIITKG